MRRKKTSKVVLGTRDRELFNYLYEVKVATTSQIGRDVFKNVTKTVIYRRLKKLIDKKFLVRVSFFNGKRAISAFSLSKTGLRKFILDGERDDYKIKRCLSDSIEHDIILNDIRHLFLGLNQVEDYFSENVLTSGISLGEKEKWEQIKELKELSPDGIVLVRRNGKLFFVGVEYEHCLKYSFRYRSLFYRYHTSRATAVFYICRDKKILKRVIRRESECSQRRQNKKVLFATLEELFSNPKKLTFQSSNRKDCVQIG